MSFYSIYNFVLVPLLRLEALGITFEFFRLEYPESDVQLHTLVFP